MTSHSRWPVGGAHPTGPTLLTEQWHTRGRLLQNDHSCGRGQGWGRLRAARLSEEHQGDDHDDEQCRSDPGCADAGYARRFIPDGVMGGHGGLIDNGRESGEFVDGW